MKNVCEAIIRFLEPKWAEWHASKSRQPGKHRIPEEKSTLMCRHTSLFAKNVFSKVGIPAKIEGGTFDDGNETHAHWWVTTKIGVVDLTAGQFGKYSTFLSHEAKGLTHYARKDAFCTKNWISGIARTVKRWETDDSYSSLIKEILSCMEANALSSFDGISTNSMKAQ